MEGAAHPAETEVARTIAGLVALFALAWIAGHPTLSRFEQRMRFNPLLATGLLFVFLGTLAAQRSVGILTSSVVAAIGPIVPLGLGWMGFCIGFDFDRKLLENAPPAPVVFLAIAFPLLFTLAGAGAAVALVNSSVLSDATIWRDLLIGGVAIAMTSRLSIRALARRRPEVIRVEKLDRLIELEQATAVVGLMFIAVYFRPHGDVVGWDMPPMAWLFVTLGIGTAMGGITYGLLRSAPKGPPLIVIVLGSIAMSAGMASFLRLPVISVCFLVGLVVTSVAGDWASQLRIVLERMERPVFFVLLLVAGALWKPLDWRGWTLAAIVVGARFLGKSLGFWAADRAALAELTKRERRGMALAPIGAFAIAVIISARDLYADAHIAVLLTAAIGSALAGELFLQWAYPRLKGPAPANESMPVR